jgi:hypothetical protein
MGEFALPGELTTGAQLDGNEYGWKPALFPAALDNAQALGYACLGGQFQFRIDGAIFELYWLAADSEDRYESEPWYDFCRRSCSEVKSSFTRLMSETDFREQAAALTPIDDALHSGSNPLQKLVFVAYFVAETDWVELKNQLPGQNRL